MYFLFLDLETTGLPIEKIQYKEYYSPKEIKYYSNSRIVEICYKIYNRNVLIKTFTQIIKPNGFIIDNESFATKLHKITKEKAELEGIDINTVFESLKNDLQEYNISSIIAHNYEFDKNVLLSELFRANNLPLYDIINNYNYICTMQLGMNYFNRNKQYKLIDLYNDLYKENKKQRHNASNDVDLCIKCFFKINLGYLTFELNNIYELLKQTAEEMEESEFQQQINLSFEIQRKLYIYGYNSIFYCFICNKKITYDELNCHTYNICMSGK